MKKSIWSQVREIEHQRREFMVRAMEDYDRDVYEPAKRKLQALCEKETGHEFRFSTRGIFPWIEFWRCDHCGAGKTVDIRSDEEKARDEEY